MVMDDTTRRTDAVSAGLPVAGVALQGRVALVTGGGSGIGRSSCRALAAAGARVVVLDRDGDRAVSVCDEISGDGGDAMAVTADVTSGPEVDRAVEECVARFGRLDVLHANAGINGTWAPIEQITDEEWQRTVDINLKGTFVAVRSCVPHFKRARSGVILVTASVQGVRVFSNTGASVYGATKAGQVAFARMLAVELGPFGIRVNVIVPGSFDSNLGETTVKRDIESISIRPSYQMGGNPLAGYGRDPDEIGKLVTFLASDQAAMITGSEVTIDGGRSLYVG